MQVKGAIAHTRNVAFAGLLQCGCDAHIIAATPLSLFVLSCYSITSSARSRIDVGNVTPMVFAVLKLTANSKFETCSTFDEPRMLIGCVIRNQIEKELQIVRMRCSAQRIEIIQRAEYRIDTQIVGDVM